MAQRTLISIILTQFFGGISHNFALNLTMQIIQFFLLILVYLISTKENSFDDFIGLCLASVLAIYFACPVAIHYLMWSIPFLLWFQNQKKAIPTVLLYAWFLLPFLFNPNALSFIHPVNIPRFVIIVSRLSFSALCLYFIFLILIFNQNTEKLFKKLEFFANYQ